MEVAARFIKMKRHITLQDEDDKGLEMWKVRETETEKKVVKE